jgi:Holliday junction resolvase RusA-like endonuclease
MEIMFEVVGMEPRPQGSKRHVGNGRFIEASVHLEPWRKAVGEAARQVWGDNPPITGPVIMDLVFVMTRPKSVTREYHTVRPDVDKLARGVNDALSLERYFMLLADDSQVVDLRATKIYGSAEEAGVSVVIRTL